jgi:hypothetical protein
MVLIHIIHIFFHTPNFPLMLQILSTPYFTFIPIHNGTRAELELGGRGAVGLKMMLFLLYVFTATDLL